MTSWIQSCENEVRLEIDGNVFKREFIKNADTDKIMISYQLGRYMIVLQQHSKIFSFHSMYTMVRGKKCFSTERIVKGFPYTYNLSKLILKRLPSSFSDCVREDSHAGKNISGKPSWYYFSVSFCWKYPTRLHPKNEQTAVIRFAYVGHIGRRWGV